MSTREPEEPGDSGDRVSEDAAWAEIVAHYGDHPEFTEPTPEPVVAHVFDDDVDEEPVWQEDNDPFLPGGFVAPDPGPLGWHGWRSVAWIGVLGSPALALIWTLVVQLTGWHAPTLLGYLLGAAFLGGFGYLVATMPKERDDPWDDGARL
ncbi:hypothetical protein [Nocardioides sp. Kera G14]|uniref:hypothetical protein n=1 Tax=Nocardioides sp. Kera G14 TaxID=2884264 RepID=UPI001D11CE0F|nr:hypothetical protein [Nocardioides sp. Kera G14]UDY22516.1 hypothetical protein LH076_10535 [Nocardioides sp. Kera G14]